MATSGLILPSGGATPRLSASSNRGLIVAIIAVGLGSCLILSADTFSWGDFTMLAAMAAASFVGAKQARRMVAAQAASLAEAEGWMTVVVEASEPTDTAGILVEPKAPPRNDPERRTLFRGAGDRRRAGSANR